MTEYTEISNISSQQKISTKIKFIKEKLPPPFTLGVTHDATVSNLLSYIRSMNQKEAETKESKEGETKEGEGGLLFSLHLRGLLWQSQCQDVPPSRAPSLPH